MKNSLNVFLITDQESHLNSIAGKVHFTLCFSQLGGGGIMPEATFPFLFVNIKL